jgi:hypothetical protein
MSISRRQLAAVAVAAVLLVCALAVAPIAAMTTKVSPTTEFCVTERVEKDIPVSFRFTVTAGGKLDIDTTIFDQNGRTLRAWRAATSGDYELRGDAMNSKFKFCFSNKMAKWTPKWVNFFIHKGTHPAIAPKEAVDPIETSIQRLATKMQGLRSKHDALQVIEHDHRNTVEDVNDRVLLWKIILIATLLGMGVVQIVFVKRFLEVRSSV